MNSYFEKYKKYKKEHNRLKRLISSHILYNHRIELNDKLNDFKYFNKDDCKIVDESRGKEGTIDRIKKYIYVAKGGQGAIYFLYTTPDDKTYKAALKFIKLDSSDFKYKFNPNYKKWRELHILQECTKLVKKGITQNLPILYKYELCTLNREDSHLLLYSEMADGNMVNWLSTPHTINEWKSFLFQIWHAVHVLQTELKLAHNDLRLLNILFFKTGESTNYRYVMNDENYYLSDEGYIFTVWDYGSSESLKFPGKFKHTVEKKLKSNRDLFFIHELYKRIRVMSLMNRYTLNELVEILSKKPKDKAVVDYERKSNKDKFVDYRYEEKFKIALIYHIIETNRFDKLYNDRKDYAIIDTAQIYLPPTEIDDILKKLNDEFNCSYRDAIEKKCPRVTDKIPAPLVLINKFLPETKIKKDYVISFG